MTNLEIRRFCEFLLKNKVAQTAMIISKKADSYFNYVIGSREKDMKALGKTLNHELCGRGGGKVEMIQGSYQSDFEKIQAAYTKYFQVFNLDQTNFAEKYPNRWDILKAKFSGEEQPQEEKEMYVNPILDEMNKNQNWVCPIQTVSSDSAFYSISNDSITLPLKSQFKDGESFYGTELHEMGHSTGVKNRLNRKGFYENDKFNYGREELVAELISALSGVYLGISVTVREENAAYLKSWCKAIKEEPKFLFTVLADAIKGSKFIAQHLNIRLDVEEVEEEKNTKVA